MKKFLALIVLALVVFVVVYRQRDLSARSAGRGDAGW